MSRPVFDPKEFEVVKMHRAGGSETVTNVSGIPLPDMEPIFNRPISAKENYRLLFSGKRPYWVPSDGWMFCDVNVFRPRFNPDNVACHIVCDGEPNYDYPSNTLRSWFDLDWVYVPKVGGSTVKPGEPKIDDMNDWEKYVSMPDLDALDWEGMAAKNREYLDTPQLNQLGILNGFWERLISLMDVEGAAIALIDEDQHEGVHRFFDQYANFLIDYIRRVKSCCDIDCVLIHDDWGHQTGSFFSLDTAMEMLVPYLRRVTDAVHDMGMFFELHSCGKNEKLVPAYLAAGVDLWCPQAINDLDMLERKYHDEPICFGDVWIDIPQDATPDQIAALAAQWFARYKDTKVIADFLPANPVFMQALYQISREAYAEEE